MSRILQEIRFVWFFADVHVLYVAIYELNVNLICEPDLECWKQRSPCLVRRVLNKELEPGIVFHMTPVELKVKSRLRAFTPFRLVWDMLSFTRVFSSSKRSESFLQVMKMHCF